MKTWKWLKYIAGRLQILLLLAFKPVSLFKKINRLTWYQGALCSWIQRQAFPAQARILEAGCASGDLVAYLSASGYTATGIDASAAMISAASTAAHDAQFQVADITKLPFARDTFDAVISASLLNIVSEQALAVVEMARVCKAGGIITIFVPAHGFSNHDVQALADALNLSGFSKAALHTWHQSAPKMQRQAVESLLLAAGLTPTHTDDYLGGMAFSITAVKTVAP